MEVLKFNAEGILANAPPPETEELLINSPAAIQTVELYIAPPPIANIVRRDFDNIESFDFLLNMRMPFNFISLGCVILLTRP